MKQLVTLVTLVTLATLIAARSAHADSPDTIDDLVRSLGSDITYAWVAQPDGVWLLGPAAADGDVSKCSKTLAQLRAASAPATRTFKLADDSRDLRAGNHTLAEARLACDQVDHMIKIKAFETWAYAATNLGDIGIYNNCRTTYDQAIAAGVRPSDRVPLRTVVIAGKDVEWSGSIEALRIKYCDEPLQVAEAKLAAEQAPYRKVLRNDKLTMALGAAVPFTLPGGETTWEPKRLAAAMVWFDAVSDQTGQESCAGGIKRKTLRRYAFDSQHKLVKTTEREYCGAIPPSAFR